MPRVRAGRGITKAELARLKRPEGPPSPQRAKLDVSRERFGICGRCEFRDGELKADSASFTNSVGYIKTYELDFVITRTTQCTKLNAPLHTIINMHSPHCPAGKWKG